MHICTQIIDCTATGKCHLSLLIAGSFIISLLIVCFGIKTPCLHISCDKMHRCTSYLRLNWPCYYKLQALPKVVKTCIDLF